MNESHEEATSKRKSFRTRLGKAFFWAGLTIILVIFVITQIISFVAAYSGFDIPMSSYDRIIIPVVVVGIALAIIGLITILLSDGLSKDESWIMMMSPCVGTT